MAESLRLALPVAALWLGMWLAFSAATTWSQIALAAVASVVAWWRRPDWWRLFAFFWLGCALVWLRVWVVSPDPGWFGTSQVEFEILSDPEARADSAGLNFDEKLGFRADLVSTAGKELKPLSSWLTLRPVESVDWQLGMRGRCRAKVEVAGSWGRIRAFANCLEPPVVIASAPRFQQFAAKVRNSAQLALANLQPDRAAALLPGLVLGDTSRLDVVSEATLRTAGLGHLTAVSGANIAILLAALQLVLARTKTSVRTRVVISVLAIGVLVVVVRPSASVVRAAAMAFLGLSVAWSGRRKRSDLILILATACLLVLDPWLATDWGFALSVAATAGLIFLGPRLWPEQLGWWARSAATAVAAAVSTLPVLLMLGLVPTFASIPANLLAEIFVTPATIFGLLAALVEFAFPFPLGHLLAQVFGQAGVWSAAMILEIANQAVHSWFAVSVLSWSALVAGVVGLFFWWRHRRLSVAISLSVLALLASKPVFALTAAWPPTDWSVVACDVGQGDATLVKTVSNQLLLVDTGPEPINLQRCLTDLEVEQIDFLVITHWHADHVGGLYGLNDIDISQTVLPCGFEPDSGRNFAMDWLGTQRSIQASTGLALADWQVLSCPTGTPGDDSGTGINNSSLVISIETAVGRVLLAADAEVELQNTLESQLAADQFDLLKIPHHGSKSQSPSFAHWTGASLAWVSVGAGNPFGHPAPETLSNYQQWGIATKSTEQCGDIAYGPMGWQTSRDC